ncbi:hypothetical protein Tco_0725906 [Tanacetum coccineum]|uniref:Uncharacterized protein n=1 Tax=Tanacetum coccineum TaxID=301880 RepID=A0ABQ4YF23_9ASTR
MENEHELSYETLTRVYLGSYEHYKGVVVELEHSKPGFELQGAKMVEMGRFRDSLIRPSLMILGSYGSKGLLPYGFEKEEIWSELEGLGDDKEELGFDTYARNPVKEILLNLNLPDHRSVLTELEVHVNMEMEIPRIVVVWVTVLTDLSGKYTVLAFVRSYTMLAVCRFYKMGTFRETLAEGNEGAQHLGPERARVYSDLSPKDKEWYNADIRATNIVLQGHQNKVRETLQGYSALVLGSSEQNVDMQNQVNIKQALNVDNVFQADDCDAFDFDVDEAPTAQTMFMANLLYDVVCEHHEVHEIHDDVQPNYVVDLHTDYASDSNMILYDQYVKDNAMSVV